MSTISAGNTLTTGFVASSDTTGNLLLSATGNIIVPANGITFSDGTSIASHAGPNVQIFTSGSGTYTTPAGAKWLEVQMVGGGGGGGGSGTSGGGAGGNGGNTTFGTSLLTCVGGGGGIWGGLGTAGGTGGTATLNSPAKGLAVTGNRGFGYQSYNNTVAYTGGPLGGTSPLGSSNLTSGSSNGAGGSGGGCDATAGLLGTGGASGGYINAIINSPSSSYSYAVGAAGTAGTIGTSGNAGIAGGAGVIIVTAYF